MCQVIFKVLFVKVDGLYWYRNKHAEGWMLSYKEISNAMYWGILHLSVVQSLAAAFALLHAHCVKVELWCSSYVAFF